MTEPSDRLNVLLIEDDPDIHFLVREYLGERSSIISLTSAVNLADGFKCISEHAPDIVLLDLNLPDTQGLKTFDQFLERVNEIPVVIFTSMDDESTALEAVQKGAQDYLVKGHITPRMLVQVLRHATERYRTQERKLRPQLIDPITGLHNLKGFTVLAEQHLRSVKRNPAGHLLFLLVVSHLIEIRRLHGDGEARHVLKTAAGILRESFRASDIIARVGDDRLVVFPTVSTPFLSRAAIARVKKSQTYYNSRFNLYKIVLRWQPLHLSTAEVLTTEELIKRMNLAYSKSGLEVEKLSSVASLS